MANVTTVILDTGRGELLHMNSCSPKYFKVTKTDLSLDPSLKLDKIDFWIQKEIDTFRVIDKDTSEFTCIVEAKESVDETSSIILFFDNTEGPDIPFLHAKLTNVIPSGNRQVITLQFKLTNASTNISFNFIKNDKNDEGLLSLNNLITLGNQITKNTAMINKLYLKDTKDTK